MTQINFKTGQESNIPTKKEQGTVYFTVDTDNNIGKIFLDHDNQTRVNIVPDRIDCGAWNVVATKAANCCFVAGSKVLCNAQGATKNIEDVKTGDIIMSYNTFTEQFYPVVVQQLIINPETTHLAFVLLDNGTSLEMNAYHPIYTTKGFHSLTNYDGYETLVIGDQVKGFSGNHTIIDIVEIQSKEPVTTYNLAVKDLNEQTDNDIYDTFIVNDCIVHNAECPT